MGKKNEIVCKNCGKQSLSWGKVFCSRSCRTSFRNRINNPAKSESFRQRLSERHKREGHVKRLMTPEARVKAVASIRAALAGKKQTPAHVERRARGWKAGYEQRGGMSDAHKAQLHRVQQSLKGPNNPNWRGGTTTERRKDYRSNAYQSYRDAVLKRDNYTCQQCRKRGGKLEVHHCWVPYALCTGIYAPLKYHPANGATLCKACHNATKTYRPDLCKQPEPGQLPEYIRDLLGGEVAP